MKHWILLRFFTICLLMMLVSKMLVSQELIAGWESNRSSGYVFVSPVFSVKLSQNIFIVFRGTASFLHYNFSEGGGFTYVTSPGAEADLAFRVRVPRFSLTFGSGFEARWTRRKLPNREEMYKLEKGLTAKGDLFFQVSSLTTLYFIFSYMGTNRYIWSRGGIKQQITNTRFKSPLAISLGIEGTLHGNRDVRTYQIGPSLEIAFLRAHGFLQFHFGNSWVLYRNVSTEERLYLGVSIYFTF